MQIALIPPIPNLDYAAQGDLDMVLTHLALKEKKYLDFYSASARFKILDNGACEGVMHPIEEVVKVALQINASEIILPDIIMNGAATILEMNKAIRWLKVNDLLGKFRLMAVPQGKTENEWLGCFKVMSETIEIDTIGFSKLSCPACFKDTISIARLKAVKSVEKAGLISKDKQYHLLGGSAQILYEVKKQAKWIRSIDTSAPFEYGKKREVLNRVKASISHPVTFYKEIRPYNKSSVEKNIKLLLEVAHGNQSTKSH